MSIRDNTAQPPAVVRKFRTNPVEMAVFSVVTLIFANSVYNLFYDQQNFRPAALTPMAANPISEGRAPASVTQAFASVEVTCGDAMNSQKTAASKVRLSGALCGVMPGDTGKLVKTVVVNNANQVNATVFTDPNSAKFSTDYIPLNSGQNSIHLEFSYRDGTTYRQNLNFEKI